MKSLSLVGFIVVVLSTRAISGLNPAEIYSGLGLKNEAQKVNFGRRLAQESTEPSVAASSCTASTLEDYDCMIGALGGKFIIHWTVETDGVSFACVTTGTGYVAIAWPETVGVMVPAEAVIGLGGGQGSASVLTYSIEARETISIIEDDSLFEIQDTSIENSDNSSVLKFKRPFDDDFDSQGETGLNIAFHPTSNELEYHGSGNSGYVTFSLS